MIKDPNDWPCYEPKCPAKQHPIAYACCPYTGVVRADASRPTPTDTPRSWSDNPARWALLCGQIAELDDDALRYLGLIRRPGCVSGSGRTDGHGLYVRIRKDGTTVCHFCGDPLERKAQT